MAEKLSQAELRRLATDFDPPADQVPKAHHTPPLKNGKRVRVTAGLTEEQAAALRRYAKKRGLSMSAAISAAVEAFFKK
ncbi:MAG: ribbon-helix-helix protein, CopG family [Schwartzia sp.]|nr:ribbon-helix-helix protein, CopG family [Schwartzia sp. (in: firmicutes)]